jgi:hypothetical protein
MDEAEREGREAADESLMDSPGADTMSDDGTIDGNEHLMDPGLHFQRHGVPPYATMPRARPRPRSMHEMPRNFHVDLPLMSSAEMQRVGTWTPSGPVTPELRSSIGPAHLNLMSSNPIMPDMGYELRSRSPAIPGGFDPDLTFDHRTRSTSRTPSRRHTIVESTGFYGPPSSSAPQFGEPSARPFEIFDEQRRVFAPQPGVMPQVNLRPGTSHLWNLGMRSAADIRQTYLRPEPDFSAFEANHDAIMATIPASGGSSRHASRSNSPHPSRVSSRSRLSNLLSGIRTYGATPFTFAEATARGLRGSRSRERSRLEEEERREAMLRAMAEADSAQQLRPDLRRGDIDRTIDLPLPHPDMIQPIPPPAYTPLDPTDEGYGTPGTPPIDENEDVTMTQ